MIDTQCADTLYAFIEEKKGKVVIDDYSLYERPQLIRIAKFLNKWNANQEVSNKEHNEHFKKYIEPIYKYLD